MPKRCYLYYVAGAWRYLTAAKVANFVYSDKKGVEWGEG
jgi:hypothetical protein